MIQKRIFKIIIAFIFIMVIMLLALFLNPHFKWKEIKVRKWDQDEWITVCRANVYGKIQTDEFGKNPTFKSITNLDEISYTNVKGYVGHVEYGDGFQMREGELFFIDNNYYFLSTVYDYDDNDLFIKTYQIENCEMDYGLHGYDISVPSPVNIYVEKSVFEATRVNLNKNELDGLFDNVTFEQAKEFYGRFTNGIADIDENNQTVLLDGYQNPYQKYYEDSVLIDFKNRTISGYDEEGKWITVDGTEGQEENE